MGGGGDGTARRGGRGSGGDARVKGEEEAPSSMAATARPARRSPSARRCPRASLATDSHSSVASLVAPRRPGHNGTLPLPVVVHAATSPHCVKRWRPRCGGEARAFPSYHRVDELKSFWK